MKYEIQSNMGPGEVIAEVAAGFRNSVSTGKMSAEEAILRTNSYARELMVLALLGFPFETGSTQLKELIEEGRRIKEAAILQKQSGV